MKKKVIKLIDGFMCTITLSQAQDSGIRFEKNTYWGQFNCEWGHRWYDLKRTKTIDVVLGAEKPTFWKSTDALYPVPASVVTLDNNIGQNPGYN